MLPAAKELSEWRIATGGAAGVAVSESQLVGTVWLQLVEKLPNPGEESEINGYVRDDLLDRP